MIFRKQGRAKNVGDSLLNSNQGVTLVTVSVIKQAFTEISGVTAAADTISGPDEGDLFQAAAVEILRALGDVHAAKR